MKLLGGQELPGPGPHPAHRDCSRPATDRCESWASCPRSRNARASVANDCATGDAMLLPRVRPRSTLSCAGKLASPQSLLHLLHGLSCSASSRLWSTTCPGNGFPLPSSPPAAAGRRAVRGPAVARRRAGAAGTGCARRRCSRTVPPATARCCARVRTGSPFRRAPRSSRYALPGAWGCR